MSKKYYLGVAVVALVLTTAGLSAFVSAAEDEERSQTRFTRVEAGDLGQNRGRLEKAFRAEGKIGQNEIRDAIEANDYQAWLAAVADRPMHENVSEADFAVIVQAHQLMKEGDFEGAKDLRAQAGLPENGPKSPRGMGMGKNPEFMANHEAMMVALDDNDYATWNELAQNTPLADKITEENFAQFVEAHNLMQAGDFEAAQKIRAELGFSVTMGQGMRGGEGCRLSE